VLSYYFIHTSQPTDSYIFVIKKTKRKHRDPTFTILYGGKLIKNFIRNVPMNGFITEVVKSAG
jgi:hypothetical protein